MNILVCISSVPDTTSKINFKDNNSKFDSDGVQYVINPYDEFGLTKAMKIKESTGGKITVITVGDASVEPVIRKTLAIGADEAIRVNMVPEDSYSVAFEISEYIKENSFNLIITGRESTDYNGGAVPGMLAELTNLPLVNACIGLEVEGNNVKLVREIDGGKEMISSSMPIIIGGQKGLVYESELRIPNMRGIMQSRTKPLSVIDSKSTNAYSSTISFEKPEEKAGCKMVDSENVSELVDLLQNEAKVI